MGILSWEDIMKYPGSGNLNVLGRVQETSLTSITSPVTQRNRGLKSWRGKMKPSYWRVLNIRLLIFFLEKKCIPGVTVKHIGKVL